MRAGPRASSSSLSSLRRRLACDIWSVQKSLRLIARCDGFQLPCRQMLLLPGIFLFDNTPGVRVRIGHDHNPMPAKLLALLGTASSRPAPRFELPCGVAQIHVPSHRSCACRLLEVPCRSARPSRHARPFAASTATTPPTTAQPRPWPRAPRDAVVCIAGTAIDSAPAP